MTLNNYPTVRPARTLDFAKSRYLPPEVTFARATPATNGSDGTYVGPNGITMSDEDTPRFTWQNGKCRGLLIEPSRTNVVINQDFSDNAYWPKTEVTVSSSSVIAPDGSTNAYELTETSQSAGTETLHSISTAAKVATTGKAWCWSLYAKPNGRDYIRLMLNAEPGSIVVFNISNGTVALENAIKGDIQPAGNGWYRCVLLEPQTGNNRTLRVGLQDGSGGSDDIYQGDGTSGAYIWGAQLEEGTFPTSYIPTAGSQATRGADSAEFTSATTSGTVINHPFGASDGRLLIALGEGAGPVPVERVDVYSQNLDQTQIRTLAGLPTSNEFWYWRVYGSDFGFETSITDAFTDGQVTVDWGDGTPQEVLTRGLHTFANGEGFYEVGFRLDSGTFFYPRYIEADGDSVQRDKIVAVGPAPASMFIKPKRNFQNSSNLEAFDATVAFVDSTTSVEDMFNNCDQLLGLPFFEANHILVFAEVCYNCARLRDFPLIDTSNGTNFTNAWLDCANMTSFPTLNMSSATTVLNAWRNTGLTSFPSIGLPEVTDATKAWRECSDLTSFPKINMDKCRDFEDAWKNCTALVDFPANFFDSWNASPFNYCFFETWLGCSALSATSVEHILDSLAVANQNAPTGSGDQITITIDYDTGTGVPYGGTLDPNGVITPTPASITTLKGKTRPWIIRLNGAQQ